MSTVRTAWAERPAASPRQLTLLTLVATVSMFVWPIVVGPLA